MADANSQEWDLVFERLTARTRASTVCIDVELAVEALLVAVVVDDDPEESRCRGDGCLSSREFSNGFHELVSLSII